MTASTILFLPGAGGSAGFWRPAADLLPQQWPKVFLSWPGLGDEPRDPGITGLDDLVNLVSACIAMAPGRVDLVGQSMGGVVTIRTALRHLYRIRRIVLTGTSGGVDVAALGGADWRAGYRAAYPRAADWITEVVPDHTGDLARITMPTLLLWGEADPISPLAVGRHLLGLLPNARLETVPSGEHDFPHAMPDVTAAALARHLG